MDLEVDGFGKHSWKECGTSQTGEEFAEELWEPVGSSGAGWDRPDPSQEMGHLGQPGKEDLKLERTGEGQSSREHPDIKTRLPWGNCRKGRQPRKWPRDRSRGCPLASLLGYRHPPMPH